MEILKRWGVIATITLGLILATHDVFAASRTLAGLNLQSALNSGYVLHSSSYLLLAKAGHFKPLGDRTVVKRQNSE